MSRSLESVRWNACVHKLDLDLYTHPKEFWGNGVRTRVNSKEKSPLPEKKFSSEVDRTQDAASSRIASPARYQRAIPALMCLYRLDVGCNVTLLSCVYVTRAFIFF